MDLNVEMHRVIPHVANAKHAVVMAAQGVSMLTLMISNAVTAMVAGGLGWYVKSRGAAGVQVDLTNLKNDVASLKTKVGI